MVLMMSSRKEMFGYAGYRDPVKQVVIDDPSFDTTEYIEATDVSVNNDLMQRLVLATNEYVAAKTGLCTYVIETTTVKKYIHKENKKELYRCMFMLMKQHGFAFGFAVTVDINVNPDGTVNVLSARTQPIDIKPPTDQSPFTDDVEGHEFTEYERFRESELELIKNK
tara:strand:- start:1019 stop:1519 length:501 start_codon:yes stop_codon:yes gene_type:complete